MEMRQIELLCYALITAWLAVRAWRLFKRRPFIGVANARALLFTGALFVLAMRYWLEHL